ncbi:DUF1003 domain-containing protein [Candidatus Daviesbacteria bacterium]|nr:DUF1003 domain-containing protein [Candidatus Daviesbacteria bacterium]
MGKTTKAGFNQIEKISLSVTNWVGTPVSILAHSLFFIGIFGLNFLGLSLDKILLVLTTAVSLEAIYLAIFIQMTVNKTRADLQGVEDDIEDIQEDVKGLETDVEEISEDIDQIQVEEKSEEENAEEALDNIESQLQKVMESLDHLKQQVHQHNQPHE